MIDLNLLRENPEAIKASQRARGRDEKLVDQAAEEDAKRRKALAEFESLRAEQNAHSKLVSTAPKEEKAALVAAAQELAAKVKVANEAANLAAEELDKIVWQIENLLAKDVARPIIFQCISGLCWQPHVKNFTLQANSIYNNWRFDDIWLDK